MGERRVVISGASGLIGRGLVERLEGRGWCVNRLVRRAPRAAGEIEWQPEERVLDVGVLEGAAAIVNLSGEPVAGRWTPSKRRAILGSRVKSTRLLAGALAKMASPPALLNASATGYYGDRPEGVVDERDGAGDDFLAEVCEAWERACEPAVEAGVRVVNMRIGVVLTARGGALAQLVRPFKLGLGGKLGSGRQGFSWIARVDALAAIEHLLEQPVSGPVNLTSPEPVSQAVFARALGRVLKRPTLASLPGWAVRGMLGGFGEVALLKGARVLPRRLLESDFVFQHPELDEALPAMLADR